LTAPGDGRRAGSTPHVEDAANTGSTPHVEDAASPDPTPTYWDAIAAEWLASGEGRVWRTISDEVNKRLIGKWFRPASEGRILKTDLFDEATGPGLVPALSGLFGRVTGIDISPSLVDSARTRFPGLSARRADVRALPFRDGEFDAVFSNSTLDHFTESGDIEIALRELHRVTRPGGDLLITMDNPVHPVVAIRNALPARLRSASRMVPFAVGATCGPGRLRSLLQRTGYDVTHMSATFHSPRVLVVLGGYLIDRHTSPATKRRYVRFWSAFERLADLPTCFLTGHFVAAFARKR
jgi:SAM-dependent methyltransferase